MPASNQSCADRLGPVARELLHLHKTYFGDTTTYTCIQARAIAEARTRTKALKDTPEKKDGVTIHRGKTKWDITITGDSEVIDNRHPDQISSAWLNIVPVCE